MGAHKSKVAPDAGVVEKTADAARLDKMLGENRPAVGRTQMSAALNQLAANVSVTADDMEKAVRVAGNLGKDNSGNPTTLTASKRGNRAGGANASGRGQPLPPSTPNGGSGRRGAVDASVTRGGSTRGRAVTKPRIGGALPAKEVVNSRLGARAAGRRRSSVQMLLRAGSRNWRNRIHTAKMHARFAIITVRRFVAATGTHDSRERLDDYFGRLCPIMTELLGAEAPRFGKCVEQIEEFLRKADEAAAAAPIAAAAAAAAASAAAAPANGAKAGAKQPQPPQPPKGVLPAATIKDLRRRMLSRALTLVIQDSEQRLSDASADIPRGPPLDASGLLEAIVGASNPGIRTPVRADTEQSTASASAAGPSTAAGAMQSTTEDSEPEATEPATAEASAASPKAAGAAGQSGEGEKEKRKRGHGKHVNLRTRASIKELLAESIGNISEEDVDKLADALKVMQVYVENANARANPMKPWAAAPVTDMTSWARTAGAQEFNYFIDAARDEYIQGAVAVHVDCSGEGLLGQMFQPTSCPYALAKEWNTPQPMDGMSSQQIRGLPIGQRQLAVLSLAAEKALGKLGRDKVKVILTVDPREEELVIRDLQVRKFYGFVRENVILLTAARRHGMRFNPRISAFEDDDDTEAHLLGPGFSLKQLAFAEQAYNVAHLNGPGPAKQLLKESALSILSAAGVRWLSSWRCGDLGRLSPEDALDLAAMGFALKASDSGAEAVMQVAQASAFDQGVVVKPHRLAQKLTLAGMSCPIAAPRVQIPAAVQSLQWISEADWAAPCGRWIFSLSPLVAALGVAPGSKPEFVWSPTLTLSVTPTTTSGGEDHPVRVYPSLHVADLPMMAGLAVSSYRSPLPVVLLTNSDAGDTMLRAAGLQDKNVAFQAFVHKLSSQQAPLSVMASSAAQHRFDVVMLLHEGPLGASPKTHNAAFRLLAQLLRAGEDTLHLVYFAQDVSELGRAQKVLDGYTPEDNPMLAVTRKVLVLTESIPVALDHYADSVGAQLVVVAAGTGAGGGMILGSVAMTVAKRSTFPLLVAKPDLEGRVAAAGVRLKAVQDEEVGGRAGGALRGGARDAPGIRVLLGVETGSVAMELVSLCLMLLRPMLDTLILGRCKGHTGAQFEAAGDDATMRLISAVELIAKRRNANLKLVKRVLEGKAPLGLVEGARRDGCDLLVMQAPPGAQLESDMMDAVAKAKGGVLVFRRNPYLKVPDV